MVQEIDAALKREAHRKEFLAQLQRELEEKTVMFRWRVIEHTPGYNTGGYYDQDVPEKNVVVSPTFDTEAEAYAWANGHVADAGKSLKIDRIRLIRETRERWVNY